MQVRATKTRVFKEKESLLNFVTEHLPKIKNSSVLVVTSKIVALAEGRTVTVSSEKERVALIKSESSMATSTRFVWLTLKDGMMMANAGIDESNGDGKLILLPKDSFKAAKNLRTELMNTYGLTDLGVVITDSRVLPMRAGTLGIALGYAGFMGLTDYRGKKDLFGRPFKFAKTNVADGLAATAVLVMGEGDECQPLAVIEDAPVVFRETIRKNELLIPLEDDIYLPFFSRFRMKKPL
jgi:coenzyme F420-0:L-glutamate ligase